MIKHICKYRSALQYHVTQSNLTLQRDGIVRYVTPFHAISISNTKFRCPYCKQLFNTLNQYKNHRRTCKKRLESNLLLRNFVVELDNTTNIVENAGYYSYCTYKQFDRTFDTQQTALRNIAKNNIDNFVDTYGVECFNAVNRLRDSMKKRKQRVKKRIRYMLANYSEVVFLTLTFRNDVLHSTTLEQRKKEVTDFLKKIHHSYIANIDFGKKNGREHYHCVVASRLSQLDALY